MRAITDRDARAARTRLDDLRLLNAHHRLLPNAMILIKALEAPSPATRASALRQMELLERQWLPAASTCLPGRGGDLVGPMWRSIGAALDGDAGASFRSDHPEAHASFAYAMAFDWRDVRRTVREVPNHRSEPPLLERLAEAEWRLHRPQQAVSVWFELCWLDPERFADAERASRVPDSALRQSWQRLQDQDWCGPVTARWLPAWMVLEEPGIAQGFAPNGGGSDPERAFDLLLRLTSDRSGTADIEDRRALRDLHAGLYQSYFESLKDRRQ